MTEMNFEQARFNMVEQQVRTWDVLDPRVLEALHTTPREDFVPAEFRKLAYADIFIPLGHGETMLKPILEGRMLQVLQIQPSDTVLQVGTGSGYLTALMARLARHVYSVDLNREFVIQAETRLATHNITNVRVECGDAAKGWNTYAPYDVIACTGSFPEEVPQGLLENLSVGGRMFAIIGEAPVMQAALITRVDNQEWTRECVFETDVPALRNIAKPRRFVL